MAVWVTVKRGWHWQRGGWTVRRRGGMRRAPRFEVYSGGHLYDDLGDADTARALVNEAIAAGAPEAGYRGEQGLRIEREREQQRERDAECIDLGGNHG